MTRTLALVAFVLAALSGAGTRAATAQATSQSTARTPGPAGVPVSAKAAPTLPPLPLGDRARLGSALTGGNGKRNVDVLSALQNMPLSGRRTSSLVPYTGPRPFIPKLTDLLNHRYRRPSSASGASIVLSGPLGVSYLEDATVAYGSTVGWICQNLKPSTNYAYIVFAPDGYAAQVRPYIQQSNSNAATFTTDTQGRCLDGSATPFPIYAFIPLSTPMTSGPGGGGSDPLTAVGATRGGAAGSDPPYSGVWTIAVKNTATGQFEAVAYSVVLGTLNFNTFSDPGYTTRAFDFASGANVYASAAGLNPGHFYAFGLVNTSGNGLPCVGTIPSNAQNNNNATCFVQGATGILPTSGKLTGQFTTAAAGPNSVGTYSVQLFDATTFDLISTQQISLNASTVTWSPLVPYNGATNGVNSADTFAANGLLNSNTGQPPVAENSVQGLTYAATGLVTGHTYRVTVSNPNGVVLSGSTSDPYQQAFTPLPTYTAAGGALPATKINFPVNATTVTSLGQAQTPFAPNVYTAQLYDTVTNAVVASKSFRLLAYAANLRWTTPVGSSATANTTATNVTTTLQNNAGTLYGSWNADGIVKITISSDSSNFVSLGRQGGVTTTTDSAGNVWNIVNPNPQTITLTPVSAGVSLAADATIPIPITIADPGSKCGGNGCTLRTSITPLHGVSPSITNAQMANTASNGLTVFLNGSGAAIPTYGLTVGTYSGAQLPNGPRYNQMMYRTGTNGASGGTYPLTFTINNTGASQRLEAAEFALPPTFDVQLAPPTLTSVIVNGVNKTANWRMVTPNPGGSPPIGSGCNPAVNDFAVSTATAAAMVPIGGNAVVTIQMPILPTTFAFQQVAGTADYCDSGGIGATPYQLGSLNSLTNDIAGTTSIDSTELGVFSLDSSLMKTALVPATIAALPGVSTVFKFTNPSTGLDPNPDYVNQLVLNIPTGAVPTSVTASSPTQPATTWYVNASLTVGQYEVDLCSVTPINTRGANPANIPCSAAADALALPPGGELDVTFNYAVAPTQGTYPIAWAVRGANGNGITTATAAQKPILNVATTTAQVAFTYVGGYTAAPTYPPSAPIAGVPGNSQPIVGSWADFNNGNAYVYELYNNGATPITDVALRIPGANQSGQDSDTIAWNVIPSSVHVYGAGANGAQCSNNGYKSLTEPVFAGLKDGSLVLSGCNIAVGQKLDIFFYAQSPYDTPNSVYEFNASVANAGTPPNPTPTTANTLPLYQNSNTVRMVTDARLTIAIPTGASIVGLYGGGTPSTSCLACTYSTAGTYPLINLGSITGTFTANDVLAASVYSDSSNGWSLAVSADVNPSTSSGQVSTWQSAATSSPNPPGGTYTKSVTAAPGTVIPTTLATPLLLSTFSGTVLKKPIDNIMNYTVTLNPLAVNNATTTTVTLTYTLIAN